MVKKCVKLYNISFSSKEVMSKVKVYHVDTDAKVMTIPRLFFSKNKRAKNESIIGTSIL